MLLKLSVQLLDSMCLHLEALVSGIPFNHVSLPRHDSGDDPPPEVAALHAA